MKAKKLKNRKKDDLLDTRMRNSKLLGKTWPWGGVTVSSGKSTDVTCKTHLGLFSRSIPWLVDLASLMCDMNCWLSCRISSLQSVVAGLISSGGDYSIHCWLDLIRSKQLTPVPVSRAWVFGEFSANGNSIHSKKRKKKKKRTKTMYDLVDVFDLLGDTDFTRNNIRQM